MIVTISVTQDDIDNGERFKCGLCPVARALRRVLLGAGCISVTPDYFSCWPRKYETVLKRFSFPYQVGAWIRAYDAEETVDPMSFPLDVPESMLIAA